MDTTKLVLYVFLTTLRVMKNIMSVKNIDCRLLDVTETVLIKALFFRNYSVDAHTNTEILNATIEYILTTKRFDESLFHP